MTVALIAMTLSSSGCSWFGGASKSADDITLELNGAINATNVEGELGATARARAKKATCNALTIYTSEPATSLPEQLRAEARLQQLRQDLGLVEADPEVPQRLINAANAIESTQTAGEVASNLGC